MQTISRLNPGGGGLGKTGGVNRYATLLLVALLVCGLSACEDKGDEKKKVSSQDRETKARLLCKHDHGLGEVIQFDGAFFTAKCNSGIIVTSMVD